MCYPNARIHWSLYLIPFSGYAPGSTFPPLSVCRILLPSYFFSCRGTSLSLPFLTAPVNFLCFLAGPLSVCQTGTTTSLPSLVTLHVQLILLQPSVPVVPALHPWLAASLIQWPRDAFIPHAHPAASSCKGPQWKLRICPLVCLLQTHPCMLKRLHDFDFFQVQIFLFFFNSFISLSEHLLSHPKSQLCICHHQRSPPLVSSCLIFFSL